MSNLQFHQPSGHSSRTPGAYPPASYEAAAVWYLSLHTYLLATIIVITLTSLWFRYSRRRSSKKRNATHQPLNQPHPDPPSGLVPKLTFAWQRPSDIGRAENTCEPGGRLRLEIDFNDMRSHPQSQPPVEQASEAGVESLRFGVPGQTAPVQELDATRVLMPAPKNASEPTPRLRGGSGAPQNTPDTETEIDPNSPIMDNPRGISALLEQVIADFDILERNTNRGLPRDALVGNERRRLIAIYRALRQRLDRHMRLLGIEPDDL